jgi:O-antigen/teichoic acid export membrane protein
MRWPAGPRAATLFEQAAVAATGFLSMLFFARHLPTAEWATFSFAAALMLLGQGMQLSIVILPMISFSRGQAPTAQDQLHWTWLNRAVLLAMLCASALSGAVVLWRSDSWIAWSFLYAVLLMPPAFGYEYLRRRLILARRYAALARAGLAYAVGVASAVGAQGLFGAPPAMAALSFWPGLLLALAVSGVRDPLRWAAPPAAWLRPLLRFAAPTVGSSLAFAGYTLAVQALLGAWQGAPAVAAFNATRMLIQPVNTLIGAFNSLDLPNAARAHAEGGRALLRFQTRAMARLVAVGGVYLVLVASFAGPLLGLLFGGRYGDVTTLWCWLIVGLLMLVTTPTENVFYVTRHPQWLLLSRLGAAAAGCGVAALSIPALGATGAVLGIAAGWLVALLGAAAALGMLHRPGGA